MPSSKAASHLVLVNESTGEVAPYHELEITSRCEELEKQLEGAEKEIRAWRTRYANLARDKDAEARNHPKWPVAVELFREWRKLCGHPRTAWAGERFWLCLPMLEKYGPAVCQRAIAGAAFEPFKTTRRNGSTKKHDDWDLIFRDFKHVEEFANRAPRGWVPPVEKEERPVTRLTDRSLLATTVGMAGTRADDRLPQLAANASGEVR